MNDDQIIEAWREMQRNSTGALEIEAITTIWHEGDEIRVPLCWFTDWLERRQRDGFSFSEECRQEITQFKTIGFILATPAGICRAIWDGTE